MRKVLLAVACCATFGLASARADVTYQYVTDKAAYLGNLGATVPVSILLQETVTGASTSRIFADGGLFGAAVMVNSPGGAIVGTIAVNSAPSPNGFGGLTNVPAPNTPTNPTITDTSNPVPSPVKTGLIVNADIPGSGIPSGSASGPKFLNGGVGTRTILLGTVNVMVGAAPQTLTVTPYGGTFNTITQAGTDLDFGTQAIQGYNGASNSPTWAFTVAVVPEPSSMALCGLVTCGLSYAGFRRRKTAISEPANAA